MGKLLRINMTNNTVTFEELPEKYRLLGGRALTSSVVADEVPPLCHPLGPNNKLVVAPGLLAGSIAPSSGRISVGGKSPLTGGIKESNAGGLPGQKLGKLGIRAVVVEGKPEKNKAYILKIDAAGAELIPADDFKNKGMYETNELLWERFGKVGILGIGPAGEMGLLNAGISCNDMENGPGRYAGRGGLGAVMGSKGLKAIVVDDTDAPGFKVANKELFDKGRKALADALKNHAVTGEALPTFGTAVLINIMNEAGGLPTRNFREGRFEGASKISGETINEWSKTRGGKVGHPCHPGCVIRCSNVVAHPDGSPHVAPLEYESDWALGANCGIDDLDKIAELNRICNDAGIDTIEAGCALAVAMEGGLADFGDGDRAIELLNEVAMGSPLGRILGNGTEFTAKAFGVSRVPVVKGQSMPAYEPRAVKGIGVTYATSTMGADHTAGYTIAPEILAVGGELDPLDTAGKGDLARAFQATTMFIDSTGYCLFIAFAILDIPEGFQGMVDTMNTVLGTEWTADDVYAQGLEWLKRERMFNEAAGFTKEDDRIPEFMLEEKLPPHNTTWDVSEAVLDSVHDYSDTGDEGDEVAG